MPIDANFTFQTLTTKSATANGSFVDMKTTPGAPRRGFWLRILGQTFSAGTAGTTVTFTIDDSSDGTNVATTALVTCNTIFTATTTSTPFETFLQIPGNVRRYARLTMTMASGGAPVLAYKASVVPTYP